MDVQFQKVVDAMLAEQGESWLQNGSFKNRSEMRNAIVITDSPDRCWRLVHVDGFWQQHLDRLHRDESAEFFAAFGSHWPILLHSFVKAGDLVPVRAFIKNGRKKGGFSISIEPAVKGSEAKAA